MTASAAYGPDPVVITTARDGSQTIWTRSTTRIGAFARAAWEGTRAKSSSFAAWFMRKARFARGRLGVFNRWVGRMVTSGGYGVARGARFIGRSAIRGVGYLGTAISGAVTWTVDLIAGAVSMISLGMFLGVVGLLWLVTLVTDNWSTYITGTFRYWSLPKSEPLGYREFLRVRRDNAETAPQHKAEYTSVFDHNVEPSMDPNEPMYSAKVLTEAEKRVINQARTQSHVEFLAALRNNDVDVEYVLHDNGHLEMTTVNKISDNVLNIDTAPFLKEGDLKSVEATISMLTDWAETPKIRGYLEGRRQALQYFFSNPQVLDDPDKGFSLIWMDLKNQQDKFPNNMVRKGWVDQIEELKVANTITL